VVYYKTLEKVMAKVIEQAQILAGDTINPLREVTQIQFYNPDGTPFDFGGGTAPVAATTTTAGVVKQAAIQADSVATDAAGVVTDFNALLAKLRAAGILDS
jgi:hypothetical protein